MEDKMKELILVTFYWIHLIATVIWIGGIIFILFIAIPSSKQVLGMVVVHFYRGLALAPRITRTASATKKATLQKLSINLVKVNLGLGLLVLSLSGIISVLF